MIRRWTETIESRWWDRRKPPLWLRLSSAGYGLGLRLHQQWREHRSVEVGVPLVSVGNITVGGSGKTPFVAWLADQLRQDGFYPVILCRGDGAHVQEVRDVTAASDPYEVGDESVMLARLSRSPVVAARDRVAGAFHAAKRGDVILLDDGFQYRQLRRCLDIVLVPAEGVGNGYLLPAGPLREPIDHLSRADLIVRVGRDKPVPLPGISRSWRWWNASAELVDVHGVACHPPERVVAVAGIARPGRFFLDLERLGLDIHAREVFPDHYRYGAVDVQHLRRQGLPVVTTMKDAVKLLRWWPGEESLWVLCQKPAAQQGLYEAVRDRLRGR
ncbi:MAG: tetraacyldisaccharide 4'-kinase [Zetaproteobacteria bacterium]|nr:MAG: tetraacyldisaccharide 4'-kinase [Zetaproteobacteria bacterium]